MARALDIVASTAGLVVLSPLFVLIGAAVKGYDGGAVFYRAKRVGQHGRTFEAVKFRSMVSDADRSGPGITTSGDPRITPVGRILRKTKLDELPQLINVLRGEMALVGPRPEDPRYVAAYSPTQRRILNARPGITSAASLQFRDEETILSGEHWESTYRNEVLPAKIAIDLEYLAHRSVWTDLKIVFQTLLALFR